MNRRQLVLGALGIVLLGVAWTGDSIVGAIPVEHGVDAAGGDYWFVAVLSVAGVLIGLLALLSGRESEIQEADMRDPEGPIELPRAGDEFDRALTSRFATLPYVGDVEREAVRDRLRRGAVVAVGRDRDCRRSRARRLVDRGAWTDDPYAVALLSEERQLSTERRLRILLAARSPFQVAARHTAAAVVALAGLDGGES